MNKRIILISLVLLQALNLFSQKIEFTYDENGNRTNRTLIVEQLKSNTVQFPVVNPKNLQLNSDSKAKSLDVGNYSRSVDDKTPEKSTVDKIRTEDEGISTSVYPNPNKGLIKVNISNMPLNSRNEMKLYDLNGNVIEVKRQFDSYSEIDITRYRNGIYILRIKINDKIYDWKIIKGN